MFSFLVRVVPRPQRVDVKIEKSEIRVLMMVIKSKNRIRGKAPQVTKAKVDISSQNPTSKRNGKTWP